MPPTSKSNPSPQRADLHRLRLILNHVDDLSRASKAWLAGELRAMVAADTEADPEEPF
jgi:hypothetical protein